MVEDVKEKEKEDEDVEYLWVLALKLAEFTREGRLHMSTTAVLQCFTQTQKTAGGYPKTDRFTESSK